MLNKNTMKQSKTQIAQIDELEDNLQHAIDELIVESEDGSSLIVEQVSYIITHLAMAAADLRIKKQQERSNLIC
ncbi:MAG: hypothetical protein ACFFDW_09425 [Candidatus Thorarchaeota archaeon]